MMKKIVVLFYVCCCCSTFVLQAQETVFPAGLDETDTTYLELGSIDTSSHRMAGEKPPARFSFRSQTSIRVFDQGFVPGCVGYTIASSIAIRLVQFCNLKCQCHTPLQPFSASYIYNQVSGGKLTGISLAVALDTLCKQGICPESLFRNDRYSASRQPGKAAREAAQKYRFWKVERVFFLPGEIPGDDDRNTLMLDLLRAYIAAGIPVMAGLRCPDDFKNFKGQVYRLTTLPSQANHAAVVVGYDDISKTVEILNSFGEKWGDQGFCRIGYEDFCRMAKYGYVARLNGIVGDACDRK